MIVSVVHLLSRVMCLAQSRFTSFLTALSPALPGTITRSWICWLKSARTFNSKAKTLDGSQIADVRHAVALSLLSVEHNNPNELLEECRFGFDARTDSDDETESDKQKRWDRLRKLQGTNEFRRSLLRTNDPLRGAIRTKRGERKQ